MATAPTLVSTLASSFATTTSPKTAGPFTCLTDDILVIKFANADADGVASAPTGGTGLTFTSRQNRGTSGSSGRAAIWTTVIPSNQTVTVSVAATGVAERYGIHVEQWRGSAGVGTSNSAGITTGSGAPSVALTGVLDNSAVSQIITDWNAAATTGKTYLTATAGTFTEQAALQQSGIFTYYAGYHADAGATGTKTVGMSAPTGQRYTIAAVEILAAAAGGINVTVTPPAAAVTAAASAPVPVAAISATAGETAASAVGPGLSVTIDETAGAVTASGPSPTVSSGGSPATVTAPAASAVAGAPPPDLFETTLAPAAAATASAADAVPTVQVSPSAAAVTAAAAGPAMAVAITATPAAATAAAASPAIASSVVGAVAIVTAAGAGPGMTVQVLAPAANAFAYAAAPTNFASSVLPVMVGDGAPVTQPDVPTHGRR